MTDNAPFHTTETRAGRWPDFIGLGVAKCGTTWVYDMLAQHPEVALGRARRSIDFCYKTEHAVRLKTEDDFSMKEIQFWNNLYYSFERKKTYLNGYQALFADASDGQIAGEITNNYLFFLLDPRIFATFHNCLPQVRLFVCLRSPIDRFISNHFWQNDIGRIHREMGLFNTQYSRGNLPGLGEDIETIIKWIQAPSPKSAQHPVSVRQFVMGLYAMQIKNIWTRYGKEQLHIIWYDDIRDRPDEVLADLCRFLNIDPTFQFRDAERPSNVTRTAKSYSPDERAALASLYKESINDLTGLLGRDLSHWNQ